MIEIFSDKDSMTSSNFPTSLGPVLIGGLLAAITLAAPAQTTYTWTQIAGGAQSWTTGANWSGGSVPNPVSGDTVDFSQAQLGADTTLTFVADRTAATWLFGDKSASAHNWILNNGNKMILAGSSPALNVLQGTLTLNNVLDSGSGTACYINTSGSGALYLSGVNFPTGIGSLTINGGTVVQGNASALPSNLTLNSPATLDLHGVSPSPVQFSPLNGSGKIDNISATAVTLTVQVGTFSGVINNSGGGQLSLAKRSPNTWTASGNSTFDGQVQILAGTLSVNAVANKGTASPLGRGNGNSNILIGNGGNTCELQYTGSGHSTDRLIVLNGNASGNHVIDASGTGAINFTGTGAWAPSAAYTHLVTLQGTSAASVQNTIAASVQDYNSSNPTFVTKTGANTWVLSGTNTYTGATTVSYGTLLVNGSLAAASTVTVSNGATLGGSGTIGGSVTLVGGASATSVVGAPLKISGALVLNNNNTFYVSATNLLSPGDYTLMTYATNGSSGAFNSIPVLGGAAANQAGLIITSGGKVTLRVVAAGVTLTSSANPSTNGQAVTFTAAVWTNGVTAVNATGNITFRVDGAAVATTNLSGGQASYTTSTLPAGAHTIAAEYGGDANYNGYTNTLLQAVTRRCQYVLLNTSEYYNSSYNVSSLIAYVQQRFGAVNSLDSPMKVGVQVLYNGPSYPTNWIVWLAQDLNAAQQYGVPISIYLDEEAYLPPDLLNWFDPNLPGYDITKTNDIEWYDWTPAAAVKLGFVNWGTPFRTPPQQCWESPRIQAYQQSVYTTLIPTVLQWYNNLPVTQKWLFAGFKVGWECNVTWHEYVANGNSYYATTNFPPLPWTAVPLGYNALLKAGLRTNGVIDTTNDYAALIGRHLSLMSCSAYSNGIPRNLIFDHSTPSPAAVTPSTNFFRYWTNAIVNPYALPATSWYAAMSPNGNNGSMRDLPDFMQAVQFAMTNYGIAGYAYGEANLIGTNYGDWRGWLTAAMRGDPNCRIFPIYNYDTVQGVAPVEQAIADFVSSYAGGSSVFTWAKLSSGNASGSWTGQGNWAGGTLVTTTNDLADFGNQDISADSTVTLDGNQNINALIFSDTGTTTAAGWMLAPGSPANSTLTLGGGGPSIICRAFGSGKSAIISAGLAGAQGFTKLGSGSLYLTGPITYTGLTTVGGGALLTQFGSPQTLAGGLALMVGTTFQENSSSTVTLSGPITGNGKFRVFSSGQTVLGGDNSAFAGNFNIFGYAQLTNAYGLGGPATTLTLDRSYNPAYVDFNGLSVSNVNLSFTAAEVTNSSKVARLRNTSATPAAFSGNILLSYSGGVDGSGSLSLSGGISGVGGLTVFGPGTLTLSGSSSYTGTTVVSNGLLLVNGDSSAATNTITVSSGAALGGTGTIGGAVTVASGGLLSPGTSTPGLLTISNSLTFSAGATVRFDLNRTNAPATNDSISVSGGLTVTGATLTVTNLGPALQRGDSFKLLNKPASGFASVNLPSLTGSLFWTNKLAVDGSIAVTGPPPTPTSLTWSVSSGQIVLNWPAGQGWQLQSNSVNLANTNSWFPVTGTTPPFTNNINGATPQVFFRLKY
jgi:autotransporter-associated beta strand protein